MKAPSAKFTRKMEEAIVALLTHRGVDEAARAVNISTQTLLRWMRVPAFDAAYRKARRDAYGQSVARLQQASSAAVSTILKLMIDPQVSAATRVRAADSVLRQSRHSAGDEDLQVRLTELEQRAALIVAGEKKRL